MLNEPILETHDTFSQRVRAVGTKAPVRLQFEKSDATMAGASIFGTVWGETE